MALQLANLPQLDDGLFDLAWQVGDAQGIVNHLLRRFWAGHKENLFQDLKACVVEPPDPCERIPRDDG